MATFAAAACSRSSSTPYPYQPTRFGINRRKKMTLLTSYNHSDYNRNPCFANTNGGLNENKDDKRHLTGTPGANNNISKLRAEDKNLLQCKNCLDFILHPILKRRKKNPQEMPSKTAIFLGVVIALCGGICGCCFIPCWFEDHFIENSSLHCPKCNAIVG